MLAGSGKGFTSHIDWHGSMQTVGCPDLGC